MANVTETTRWETGVYQIEKSDKVLGGAEGKVNVQAQQLANRTAYLKQQVESKANKTDLTNGLNGKANSSHTHTMANITDLAAAMNAKANLASPTFTGIPRTTTPTSNASDEQIANVGFVKTAIAALVGSAPEALDTLEELSNALANDANLKKTLLTEIGKKANASHNHTMSQITDFEIKTLTTEDLDSIKKTGFYKQDNNSNAPTARHYPENNKAGVLEVYPSVYGYMQVYRIYDNLRVYARNMASGGTWGNWARLDGRDKLNYSDFTNFKNLLVGIPFPYPLAAVPSGCLAFNGQTFNKTTYPILAQKYPSGVLPDLRGEFIRGWDNGRGVDSGRIILTSQSDNFKSHNHISPNVGSKWTTVDADRKEVATDLPNSKGEYPNSYDYSPAIPTSDTGGSETRPRNIAYQYICLAA